MDKQERWQQENAKFQERWQRENTEFKEHGFKWRKVFDPAERWQLYDSDGTPITKQWAREYIQTLQHCQEEAAIASIYSISCSNGGVLSEAAVTHPDVTVCAGDHIMLSGDTYFLPDASLARHKNVYSGFVGHYTVSDGTMFIFDGESFYAESEARDFAA